jgi:hypothetical protein
MLRLALASLFLISSSLPVLSEVPFILIKDSTIPLYKKGQRLYVGQPIKTGKSGVVNALLSWGGVRSISVLPNTSFMFSQWGYREKGGRYVQLDVDGEKGEALVSVLTINPSSLVKACFRNRWSKIGCAVLRSKVRIADLSSGESLLAVEEGHVTAYSSEGNAASVEVRAGQYSIFDKDALFSPPQSINSPGFLLQVGRSRAVGVWQALPGWRFSDCSTTFQGPLGRSPKMVPPTQPCGF